MKKNNISDIIKFIDSRNDYIQDKIYRHLWKKYVVEDIKSHISDMGDDITLTAKEISAAADKFVYQVNYDCNLDYWTNIETVIYDVINSRQ